MKRCVQATDSGQDTAIHCLSWLFVVYHDLRASQTSVHALTARAKGAHLIRRGRCWRWAAPTASTFSERLASEPFCIKRQRLRSPDHGRRLSGNRCQCYDKKWVLYLIRCIFSSHKIRGY